MNSGLRARTVVVLCALLISACATVRRTPVSVDAAQVDAFELSGRVNVRVERSAYPGRIRWQHAPQSDEVWMYSPIGVAVAHMRQDLAGATLTTSDGKEYHGEHITQLARKVLGYELPLEGLQYWVRGLPWPALDNVERQVDEAGRLKQIQQGPWQVDYLDWSPAGASGFPSKLDLTGEGLRMRLVVDEWKINTAPLR